METDYSYSHQTGGCMKDIDKSLNPETNLDLSSYPLEDRSLKMAAQFFGQELMPYLGVEGTVVRIAPTEQIHLEVKSMLEDFNFEMEDGTWKHFEFESDDITEEDLRRFRFYEAVIAYYYKVEVTTYVICTSKTEKLRNMLIQGINQYKVNVLRLKNENADEVIRSLEQRRKEGNLSREDLIHLLLTPLMSGDMTEAERIERSFSLIRSKKDELAKDDVVHMESVLYALAVKLLTRGEMKHLEEVFSMSYLSELMEERGIRKGVVKGTDMHLIHQVCAKIGKGKSVEVIADELEESVERIKRIYDAAVEAGPEFDYDQIYQKMQG